MEPPDKVPPLGGKATPTSSKATPTLGEVTHNGGKTSGEKSTLTGGKTTPTGGKTTPTDGKTTPTGGKTTPTSGNSSLRTPTTTPVFPAANSPQRVNGLKVPGQGARKKVELTAGHSLLDWIRYGNSGRDLTGVGGMKGVIWDDELAKHNTEDDAWLSVRGIVYNVTPYLDFHPGGRDYLMMGAGEDATHLFDTYHTWINAESMLAKCMIGQLKKRPVSKTNMGPPSKPVPSTKPLSKSEIAVLSPSGKPRYEWFQKDDRLMIVIYTKWSGLRLDHVTVDYHGNRLTIITRVQQRFYLINLDLEKPITSEFEVHVNEKVGKVDVIVKKSEDSRWNSVGSTVEDHAQTLTFSELGDLTYRYLTICERKELTHDVFLYKLQCPDACRLPVPVGYHVFMELNIEDLAIQRPYTIVNPSINSTITDSDKNDRNLYLMIKHYADGLFTSALAQMDIGSRIRVSIADGSFDLSRLTTCKTLIMYAAGTGFTPMVRLINIATVTLSISKIRLVFFNKEEGDIVWRDDLEKLTKNDERFDVWHVLSQSSSEWQGRTGRISDQIVAESLPISLDMSLICICGPIQFTQLTIKLLKSRDVDEHNIHCFTS